MRFLLCAVALVAGSAGSQAAPSRYTQARILDRMNPFLDSKVEPLFAIPNQYNVVNVNPIIVNGRHDATMGVNSIIVNAEPVDSMRRTHVTVPVVDDNPISSNEDKDKDEDKGKDEDEHEHEDEDKDKDKDKDEDEEEDEDEDKDKDKDDDEDEDKDEDKGKGKDIHVRRFDFLALSDDDSLTVDLMRGFPVTVPVVDDNPTSTTLVIECEDKDKCENINKDKDKGHAEPEPIHPSTLLDSGAQKCLPCFG